LRASSSPGRIIPIRRVSCFTISMSEWHRWWALEDVPNDWCDFNKVVSRKKRKRREPTRTQFERNIPLMKCCTKNPGSCHSQAQRVVEIKILVSKYFWWTRLWTRDNERSCLGGCEGHTNSTMLTQLPLG
jgi:hypothetical protein